MGEQTRKLLEECSKGCKMAIGSIDQIQEHVKDRKLKELISGYRKKHRDLEEESGALLAKEGEGPPPAGLAASAMSWITTNVKLMMDESSSRIAGLLMDGCNMGVKSLNKYLNKYKAADERSKDITKRLINIEQDLALNVRQFL